MEQTKKVITKNYENDNHMYEYFLHGEVLDGWQMNWHENGKKRFEVNYTMGAPTGVVKVYWESGDERFTLDVGKREVTINGVVTKECPKNVIDSLCDTKDAGLVYSSESDTYFLDSMEWLIHSDDNHMWTCPVELRETFSRHVNNSDYQEVERFE